MAAGVTAVRIEPARPDHVALLAPVMRAADRQEVWASSRSTPEQALRRCLASSSRAWTVFFGGEVGAMWGVAPLAILGRTGVPWLLTSPAVERHPIAFLRRSVTLLDEVEQGFAVLRNHVDARQTRCLPWLRWLGFTVEPAVPVGPDRLPFHPVERRNPHG